MELIINLTGDYDAWTMRRLCREIEPAREAAANVVLDMSRVNFIDATCANELIKLYEWRSASALRPTCLVIPDEATREMLLLLGLDENSMRARRLVRRRPLGRPA
jgi:anti-anti-sigma regulatory factor